MLEIPLENTGSTSWKPLRSSSRHALDDDDDNVKLISIALYIYYMHRNALILSKNNPKITLGYNL